MSTVRQLAESYVREMHHYINQHSSSSVAFDCLVRLMEMSRMVSTSAVIKDPAMVRKVLRHLQIVANLLSPDEPAFDDGVNSFDTSIADKIVATDQLIVATGQLIAAIDPFDAQLHEYPAVFLNAARQYLDRFSELQTATQAASEGVELINRAGAFELDVYREHPEYGLLGELVAHLDAAGYQRTNFVAVGVRVRVVE